MTIPKPSQVFRSIVRFYIDARKEGKIPFLIVFAIALYVPFEEFIIKWLPAAVLLRFLPELILYGLLAKVIGQRVKSHTLRATPIDLLILMFFLSAILSAVLNKSSLFGSIESLRALWRYLSVFYIVVNIEISLDQLLLIINSIRIAGLIQGFLASIQYFMPASIQQVFAPSEFEFGDYQRASPTEEGRLKIGSAFGTFSGPAVLCAFLLIALLLSISHFYASPSQTSIQYKNLIGLAAISFGIFASKKRAPLLLAFVVPAMFMFFQKRIRGLLRLGWVLTVVIFLSILLLAFLGTNVDTSFTAFDEREQSIDLASYLLQVFDPEYWEESSENSRGWVVITIFRTLFSANPWFGFGPDLENMRTIMAEILVNGRDRAKIIEIGPIEDVYWMVMLGYYGLIGIGIYALIIWRLFRAGKWLTRFSSQPEYKMLGSMFCTFIVITVFYNFIERAFKLRAFSFYFWLFSGLVINTYNTHRLRISKIDNFHASDLSQY